LYHRHRGAKVHYAIQTGGFEWYQGQGSGLSLSGGRGSKARYQKSSDCDENSPALLILPHLERSLAHAYPLPHARASSVSFAYGQLVIVRPLAHAPTPITHAQLSGHMYLNSTIAPQISTTQDRSCMFLRLESDNIPGRFHRPFSRLLLKPWRIANARCGWNGKTTGFCLTQFGRIAFAEPEGGDGRAQK
jgi:hypothetical protein